MRPKFQKRSALKLAGQIIPEAKHSGISDTFQKRTNGGANKRRLFIDIRANETDL